MSVLLEYHSVNPVSAEIASNIDAEQRALLKERCYWAEPLFVQLDGAPPSILRGDNSLFNSGGYTAPSGEWMEVSEAEDYLMAWSDTDFIFRCLASWSQKSHIQWKVYSAGDYIGEIRDGNPSDSLKDFSLGLLEASGLSQDEVPRISAKFSNRCDQESIQTTKPVEGPSSNGKAWWRFW